MVIKICQPTKIERVCVCMLVELMLEGTQQLQQQQQQRRWQRQRQKKGKFLLKCDYMSCVRLLIPSQHITSGAQFVRNEKKVSHSIARSLNSEHYLESLNIFFFLSFFRGLSLFISIMLVRQTLVVRIFNRRFSFI